MPQVDVLMPVYNGMRYLAEAVESIRNQTLTDWKLIAVDDGSTDGSAQFLDTVADSRIQVIHKSHSGLGATLNTGLELSTSEFVARMDADDCALPVRLEKQLRFISEHSDVGLVGTQIAYIGSLCSDSFPVRLPCHHETIAADLLRGHHAICHPTVMSRASLLKQIGGYRVDGIGEDWDMFLRMAEVSNLANVPEVLQLYRIHNSNVTSTQATEVRLQLAYACDCARRRLDLLPAVTFQQFVIQRKVRPFWHRFCEEMDENALRYYRLALTDILGSHRWKGYSRLALAAVCSPPRAVRRVRRSLQSR